MRLAIFAEVHGDGIGRVNFEKVVNAARKRRAVEAVAQELRNENVRRALDVVTSVRMTFEFYAQRAQFFDPAPDLLPRYADFFGDFCAADDDGGIFGEQRQERINAPVGLCPEGSRFRFVAIGNWEGYSTRRRTTSVQPESR